MEYLRDNIGEPEYLIEFLLYDISDINEFEAMYQASNLPQKDTAITYSLYRVLNALTDGIVAAGIVFGDEPTGALNSKATDEVMDILANKVT